MSTPRSRPLVFTAGLIALAMIVGIYCWSIGLQETITLIGCLPVLLGAVTANQLTKRSEGCRGSLPVYTLVRCYEGTLAFVNSTGYLVPTVASGANAFAGVMVKDADNSGGSSGDVKGEF